VRARLGLKSTGFRLGVLRLDPPAARVAAGAIVLTGVAKAVEAPVVEQRAASGAWATAKRVQPSATGEFTVRLRIAATTVYRLSAAGLAGPAVTVRVAP
jgi:hypothetical protein